MSAPNNHPELSPYDRVMRRRRRSLLRDWILVAVALVLAITAGVFRNDHRAIHSAIQAEREQASAPSAQ
jgi:hypothetical protein